MLVPADVRKQIDPESHGVGFFLIMGINRVPWLYPDRYYEHLVSQVQPEMIPGEDALAFDALNFAMASRMEWDKQGRILIPEKTFRRTGLGRDVALIGMRDHLELMNREDWETRREQLLAKSLEIALRAKQARQVQSLHPSQSQAG